MEIIIALILVLCCSVAAFGQQKPAAKVDDLEEKRPATISLLSSYYGQDGEHGAVNGGIGSQLLKSYTQEMSIYVPVHEASGIKVHGGVDHFTSASLRVIDKYVTRASTAQGDVSGKETRIYGNAGVDIDNKKGTSIHSPSFGFSEEYDVRSVNAGYSWTKHLPEKNMIYQLGGSFVADRWLVIYPGEFRTQVTKFVYSDPNAANTGNGSYTGSGGSQTNGSHVGSQTGSGYKPTSGSGGGSHTGGQTGSGGGSHTTGASETTGSWTDSTYTTGATTDTVNWVEVPVGYARPLDVTGRTIEKNGKSFPVDYRYSWAITNSLTYTINERMNGAVGIDVMGQSGLLSTPFYRVYFSDDVTDEVDRQVAIERLPRKRLKAALYGRYNYQITDRVALRTWARYYGDTWGIHAGSATVEVPVKLLGWLTANPFYRIHLQSSSKYFKPYGEHVTAEYYTSDHDLSGFNAHKVGMALRISPLTPLFSLYNKNALPIFAMQSIGIRYAYYMRSNGLTAQAASMELNFNL